MASFSSLVFLMLLGAGSAVSIRSGSTVTMNPIRRVVTMMQNMQKKVEAEGQRDQELFDKFMCYCTTGRGELEASIKAAGVKIPQLESALQEAQGQQVQLKAALKNDKQERADAKEALSKATALREKEAAAFAKESSESETNLAALGKAIAALEKGVKGGFLQSSAAGVVRHLTIDMDLSNADRDVLASFLSQKEGESYAPQSGQITGILKQMLDTMKSELAEAVVADKDAITSFKEMAAAKEKEIALATKAIETKTERNGEVGVKIVNLKEDLDDTTESLSEDEKFAADLDKNCKTAEADYEVVKKTRSEELLALADTIKILNDDDALDLFKKTLPTPSFLQTKITNRKMKSQALHALQAVRSRKDPRLDLIALALHGKKVNMDKVIKMIDDMVALLGDEQKADNEKKAYCEGELDKAEDEYKTLVQEGNDLAKAIEDGTGRLKTLTADIATMVQGIKDLDKQVADATKNRKDENAEYKQVMADDGAAKELLKIAKNRLNKFYNPKMYKPAAAPEFVQVASVTGNAPPPPPEAVGAYQKKGQESNAVLSMVDALVADLDKEMQEVEVEEKDSQAEYEALIKDSAEKRAADSKSLAEKEDAKADLEAEMEKAAVEKKDKLAEEMAKAEYRGDVHKECDWLLANFDVRKEARTGEVEALKNAKAVLSGADYSL